MALGTSLFLIAAGAILAFAVSFTVVGIDIQTVGIILMVVGVIGFVASLIMAQGGRGGGDPYGRGPRA